MHSSNSQRFRIFFPFEDWEQVVTVDSLFFAKRIINDLGEGSGKVDLTHHLVGNRSLLDFAGPFDDEGHTVTSFVDIALHATILARAPLFEFLKSFEGMGLGSIVGGEDDQGVVGKAVFFQGVHHLAHHGVGLDDEVSVVTGF